MTIDHIGAYLFPEIAVFRVAGRVTLPVWFFLIGYSQSHDIPRQLWVYALLLALLTPFIQTSIFPLNILATFIICRFILNLCEERGWLDNRLPELMVASVIMAVPTSVMFEYGATGFLFALFGRMIRSKRTAHIKTLIVCSYVTFIAIQLLALDYNIAEMLCIIIGTAWMMAQLAKDAKTIIWDDWRTSKIKTAVAVLSRNTLVYYFYHRVALQVAGALLIGSGIGFSIELF